MFETAEAGSNFPPRDLLLGEPLRERLQDEYSALIKRANELIGAEMRMPPIGDETAARQVSDFIKQIGACMKVADACRVDEKEPYLDGGRGIDGFFKAISDPLASAKRRVESALTNYLRRKEAEERQRREAAALQARMEEERQRREAEEAAAKIRDEQTLAAAIAAEQAAKATSADAEKAERAATVNAAELSRTRGEYGAVSSLRTYWVFSDLDRASLDLEALRPHLSTDSLERAVSSFVRAGGRELRGVRIHEQTSAVVR